MRSVSVFECPFCFVVDNQQLVAIGSEISYRCLHCKAYHAFLENPYWDFVDNFRGVFSRYIGSTDQNEWRYEPKHVLVKDLSGIQKLQRRFSQILNTKAQVHTDSKIILISRTKLSSKESADRTIFFANASCNTHFQECFRAVVQMKDHLSNSYSKSTYNILIRNFLTASISPDKLLGLDELWEVDNFSKLCTYECSPSDLSALLSFETQLNAFLDTFKNHAYVISKCPKPAKHGSKILKDLLRAEPNFSLTLSTGLRPKGKYVAILLRQDSSHRAGFWTKAQIEPIWNFIREHNRHPVLVACSHKEQQQCISLGFEHIYLEGLVAQSFFFENFCIGVICGAGSCCNIPCLHHIPMIAFTKDRCYPTDFYCFGRLASKFEYSEVFGGKLFISDNVIEIRVDKSQETSFFSSLELAKSWIEKL